VSRPTPRALASVALTTLLATSFAAGCMRAGPRGFDLVAWRAGAVRVDSLTADGRLDEALGLARDRVALARNAHAPVWFEAEARAFQTSLARRTTLGPEARATLELADREMLEARALAETDSAARTADLCRAVWRARSALLGPDDVRTADAALDLAAAELAVGHPGEADSMAHAAREQLAAKLGDMHPRVADADELQGRIIKDYTGRLGFDDAYGHYAAALRVRSANEGARSLAVAETLHDLGNLYRNANRPDDAFAKFRDALTIRRAILGNVHDRVASTYGAMAFLRAGQGRWSAAESLAHLAVDATPAGGAINGRSTRLGLRGQALRHLGRLGEAEQALRQSLAMRESLWAGSARDEGSTIVGGLALYRDLALTLAEEGRGDEAFEALEHGSARLLAGRLAPGADPWRGLLPRLRRTLGEDEALLAWPNTATTMFVGDYPLYAAIVRSTGPVRWVRIDRSAPLYRGLGTVRDALWREMLAAASWPRRVTDTTAATRLARAMWHERFAPLEPGLAGVRHLIVCAPDFMSGGPLGVLVDGGGHWLADRYTITYTPSALMLVTERERPLPQGALGARPALLVGDPAYPDTGRGHWERLTGSGDEIRSLAARLPAARTLTGAAASAGALRDLAAHGGLARYRLLHIAAHTVFDPRRVMDAAFVLAPDSAGTAASRITAREIRDDWKLDADVVSLAACRTVSGVSSLSEGTLGLRQAFLAAGARALLVTLWPVDDRATEKVMDAFYSRLTDPAHPVHAAEALREAQAELRGFRAADGSHPYAHPAYWGAFALIGDAE